MRALAASCTGLGWLSAGGGGRWPRGAWSRLPTAAGGGAVRLMHARGRGRDPEARKVGG
jgi:hypothetical protein